MKKIFSDRRYTYIISSVFHTLLLLLFTFISLGSLDEPLEYVEIDFGSPGSGMRGASPESEKINKAIEEIQEQAVQEKTKEEIKPPVTKQEFEEPIVKREKKEEEQKPKEEIRREEKSETIHPSSSKNLAGEEGFGSEGFSFDWGGRGTRKILRWEKPIFPAGVQKEIDIKIRFIILPNGSVVSPIPIIKADTQLEDAAIAALRTWKFEPLRLNQVQFEQNVVITIPYRLE
jgi:protein TonB